MARDRRWQVATSWTSLPLGTVGEEGITSSSQWLWIGELTFLVAVVTAGPQDTFEEVHASLGSCWESAFPLQIGLSCQQRRQDTRCTQPKSSSRQFKPFGPVTLNSPSDAWSPASDFQLVRGNRLDYILHSVVTSDGIEDNDRSRSIRAMSSPGAGPSKLRKLGVESDATSERLDVYRPLANALQVRGCFHLKTFDLIKFQRPIDHLIPPTASSQPPSLPTLLDLDASTYSSRLQGKTLLFDPTPDSKAGSTLPTVTSDSNALVKGKKRNRGDPRALAHAKADARESEKRKRELGLDGMRKVRKRIKGGIRRGMQIESAQLNCSPLVLADMSCSYKTLLPLHHLHTTYMIQLLALPPLPSGLPDPVDDRLPAGLTPDGVTSKLSKADFTGIQLVVLSSRNPSLEGIRGIVIEETGGTFLLVSEDDRVRVIPKQGTLFRLQLPAYSPSLVHPNPQDPSDPDDIVPPLDLAEHLQVCPRIHLDILGSAFAFRSAERAGRKFRPAQVKGGGSGWGEEWVKTDLADVLDRVESEAGKVHRGDIEGESPGEKNGKVVRGVGAAGRRKKGKARRKDPPPGGSLDVFF